MKLIFAIVGLVCIAQVYGYAVKDEVEPDLPEIDDAVLDCIQRALEGIETDDVELQGSLAALLDTFRTLRARHTACQDIVQNDPPNRFEEAARDACMLAWRANVAAEILRISNAVSNSADNAREFWSEVLAAYQDCIYHEGN